VYHRLKVTRRWGVLPALKQGEFITREQEARLAGREWGFTPPCNVLPDVQDPRVSIRPLALPTNSFELINKKGN